MPLNPSPPPATRAAFPADGLERLARLILRGDVVFFIGAGFSLDSEKNFASRFIRRLLIRLEAFGKHLGPQAEAIRNGLRSTFDLGPIDAPLRGSTFPCASHPCARFPYSDQDIRELARRYYETNDWFCNAFAHLLKLAAALPDSQRETFLNWIRAEEELIRTQPGGPGTRELDSVPLNASTLPALIETVANAPSASPSDADAAIGAAGKALFLDTMGFRDPAIMAGDPGADSLREISESYGTRLLPRHHVLARFARDGLCATTITTNFDLLLEGAFRLAGFQERSTVHGPPRNPLRRHEPLPPTLYSEYARITSPTEFFKEGKAHRTAVLVKMHGCTGTYRDIQSVPGSAALSQKHLRDYLKAMVFTYREIQNWRDDAWAADYLRTLLRTRTVVFAGYSLQDPVVHDTFRTVYEEMARIRRRESRPKSPRPKPTSTPPDPDSEPTPEDTPAFFFDVIDAASIDKKPFHALEVLGAACDAIGAPRNQDGWHPNFLRFHSRNSPAFPNLDEVCSWLFHLVLRYRQQECLREELQRTLTALHGRARPEQELNEVVRRFDTIFHSERTAAQAWETVAVGSASAAQQRRELGRISSWSESFHVGLLREFATVDQLRRQGGFSLELNEGRRFGWYYPFTQDTGWTCWAVVVEIALRQMIEASHSGPLPHPSGSERVWAAASDLPTVLFHHPPSHDGAIPIPPASSPPSRAHGAYPILHALSIRFGGFDRIESSTSPYAQPNGTCIWVLQDRDAPWRPTEWEIVRDGSRPPHRRMVEPNPAQERCERRSLATQVRRAPPASVLWRWASRTQPPTRADRSEAAQWLGLPHN